MDNNKKDRWPVLQQGIAEAGGNKVNRERKREICNLIMRFDRQYMFIVVEAENPNKLKSLIYYEMRKDKQKVFEKWSFSFNYINNDGTIGSPVNGNNFPADQQPPYKLRITRNKDKSDEQIEAKKQRLKEKQLNELVEKMK